MHPNAQAVMRGFQAFAEGDMATLKGLFADDAIFHAGSGRNKWSGDITGPDAIVQYMSEFAAEVNADYQLHAVLADDDHVVVLVKSSLARNGESFSGNGVYVYHVSDGKATEVWTLSSDPYGLDEFLAG
jgi:ketosteroid isomerase-like protein